MLIATTSRSGSSGGLLFAVLLGGILLGGAAGAAITASLLKNDDDEDDDPLAAAKKRQSRLPAGTKSRSLEGIDGNETAHNLTATETFDDVTHVNFLSDIMARLWPFINVAGSDMIRTTVEPMFAEMMPGPMKSLKFKKIDLGTVPIVFDNVIVHELNTQSQSVQFDWDFIWNSSCNIQLAADYGIAFGVKSIKLRGRMSFLLKPLSNEIPCVDAIQYSFINPPDLEIDFTGLANLADFSMVEKTIRQIIQDVLKSMIVLPVRMMYKMTPTADLYDIYTPLKGIARVRVHSGRGFQVEKRALRSADVPDVYCVLQLGTETPFKTTVQKDSLSPVWPKKDATTDFLLTDKDQILSIEAWDEDTGPMDSDDFLGHCQVTIGRLLLAPNKTMELQLLNKLERKGSDKPTGAFVTLSVEVIPFSSRLEDITTSLVDGKEAETNPELGGLLTILVNQAFNLPIAKEKAESFVKVLYGDKEIGVTGIVTDLPGYDALNPTYELPFLVPLASTGKRPDVKLHLINKESVLGEIVVKHQELLRAQGGVIRDKNRKIGKGGASLAFSVSLVGVKTTPRGPDATVAAVDDSTLATTQQASSPLVSSAADASTETVRVSIFKGHGFQSRKKGRFKKADVPDVYCVVKVGSDPQPWRTATIKDNEKPVWKNETNEYPYVSPNQVISIDVFDENSKTKDDFYGNARTTVGKVLLNGGSLDVEVMDNGKRLGLFITVGCSKL